MECMGHDDKKYLVISRDSLLLIMENKTIRKEALDWFKTKFEISRGEMYTSKLSCPGIVEQFKSLVFPDSTIGNLFTSSKKVSFTLRKPSKR